MSRFDGKVVDFPIVIDELGIIEDLHFSIKISLSYFSTRNLKLDLFTRFSRKDLGDS